jgi:hypothetical protein
MTVTNSKFERNGLGRDQQETEEIRAVADERIRKEAA